MTSVHFPIEMLSIKLSLSKDDVESLIQAVGFTLDNTK
jgi:hypothetical protein